MNRINIFSLYYMQVHMVNDPLEQTNHPDSILTRYNCILLIVCELSGANNLDRQVVTFQKNTFLWVSLPDSALIEVHLCYVDLISSQCLLLIALLLCPLEKEQALTSVMLQSVSNSYNFCPLLISIQVLFTSDDLFFGEEKMFFFPENNFLLPPKQIIRCKQDLY